MSNAELQTIEEIKQLANIIDVSAKELQTGLKNLIIAKESGAWYESRCVWDYCSSSRTTEAAEPQPDDIQFRTVDDLGRICIPKDIRDKLGIKPGTECAVYSMDELTNEKIIVIRRNKNDKTNQVGT